MTRKEIYRAYLSWLGQSDMPPQEFFLTPFANKNIFEDDLRMVNRMYFIIPKLFESQVECFIFYEENEFVKDSDGNAVLVKTTCHLMEK